VVQNSVGSEGKSKFTCNCATFPDFKEISTCIPDNLSSTKALSNEIDNIKSDLGNSYDKAGLIQFLSSDIFNKKGKYSKLFDFANKRLRTSEFKQWKSDLEISLVEIIDNVDYKNSPQTNLGEFQKLPVNNKAGKSNINAEDRTADNAIKSIPHKKSDSLFSYKINIIAISLLLFFLFLLYKLNTSILEFKKDILERINKSNSAAQPAPNIGNSLNNSSSEIKRLADNVKKFREELIIINKELIKLSNEIKSLAENPEPFLPSSSNVPVREEPKEILFLSNPNSNGSFNDSSALKAYREGASIYEFTLLNSTEATFKIHKSESSMKMALQFPEDSLLPVCESENEYDARYNKVETINLGKVALEGSKWILKAKAIIRYGN